jgi:hypothetical protein
MPLLSSSFAPQHNLAHPLLCSLQDLHPAEGSQERISAAVLDSSGAPSRTRCVPRQRRPDLREAAPPATTTPLPSLTPAWRGTSSAPASAISSRKLAGGAGAQGRGTAGRQRRGRTGGRSRSTGLRRGWPAEQGRGRPGRREGQGSGSRRGRPVALSPILTEVEQGLRRELYGA